MFNAVSFPLQIHAKKKNSNTNDAKMRNDGVSIKGHLLCPFLQDVILVSVVPRMYL